MNQHAVKFRPFSKLRARMTEYGYTQEMLAAKLGISQPSIGERLTKKAPWKMSEAYTVLELLDIPISEIGTYFPPKEVCS